MTAPGLDKAGHFEGFDDCGGPGEQNQAIIRMQMPDSLPKGAWLALIVG
jgi:hypothetical protein